MGDSKWGLLLLATFGAGSTDLSFPTNRAHLCTGAVAKHKTSHKSQPSSFIFEDMVFVAQVYKSVAFICSLTKCL